mmetsp:Transcript_40892/g.102970  ORF Transcript_40892/g.102970 Transcript_40892/m.102970 type:complete len:232 (+) Transcript_40892:83-778(+)
MPKKSVVKNKLSLSARFELRNELKAKLVAKRTAKLAKLTAAVEYWKRVQRDDTVPVDQKSLQSVAKATGVAKETLRRHLHKGGVEGELDLTPGRRPALAAFQENMLEGCLENAEEDFRPFGRPELESAIMTAAGPEAFKRCRPSHSYVDSLLKRRPRIKEMVAKSTDSGRTKATTDPNSYKHFYGQLEEAYRRWPELEKEPGRLGQFRVFNFFFFFWGGGGIRTRTGSQRP